MSTIPRCNWCVSAVRSALQHHTGESRVRERRRLVHTAAAVSDVLQERKRLPGQREFRDRRPGGKL